MQATPIISADSHVFEPADLWETRLDRKFRDRAPGVIMENGRLYLTAADGIKAIVSPFSAVGKRGAELQEHMAGGFDTVRRGGWDPLVRLKDQDTDGVAAEILYTSHAMALFGLQDAELQLACFRAYNDWLAEFCSASPRRLIGIGLISVIDPRAGVTELERCIKLGLKSGMISNDPVIPYDDRVYDPLWRAACELDMPLSMHSITGGKPRDMAGNFKISSYAR
jgi:predicted TIM-barrel fold metal-dependent hydrolase